MHNLNSLENGINLWIEETYLPFNWDEIFHLVPLEATIIQMELFRCYCCFLIMYTHSWCKYLFSGRMKGNTVGRPVSFDRKVWNSQISILGDYHGIAFLLALFHNHASTSSYEIKRIGKDRLPSQSSRLIDVRGSMELLGTLAKEIALNPKHGIWRCDLLAGHRRNGGYTSFQLE